MDVSWSSEVAAMLRDPAMIIMSAECDTPWPVIARGLGASIEEEGTLDLLFAADRYPVVAGCLEPHARMSATITRLSDYLSYQLKGRAALHPLAAADIALVSAYRQSIVTSFGAAGIVPSMVLRWLAGTSLVKARLAVSEAYIQTPGPLAGQSVDRARS
jgi:hypothetical protein